MQVDDIVIDFDKLPFHFNLHVVGDWQLGSENTEEAIIDSHIDQIIADENAAVLSVGDLEDEDRPSTRIMRAKIAAERPEVVKRDTDKHLAELKRTLIPKLLKLHKGTRYGFLGGVAGHHYTQVSEMQNSVQVAFRETEAASNRPEKIMYWGQMSAFLTIRFRGKGVYAGRAARRVGHIQHGEGGGTKSGTLTKLDRAAQGFMADFYVRGHDCQIVAAKYDQLYPKDSAGSNEILSRNIAVLNIGSATQGYKIGDSASYVESKMMRPAAMGWGVLRFTLRRALACEDKNQALRVDVRVEI